MAELLIGCGARRVKDVRISERTALQAIKPSRLSV
jgi:hypothetical protein